MPVIEQLKPRRREQWIEILADNGDMLLLPTSSLPGWWETGFSVPDEEWERTARMSSYHQMYDKACRMLARREHFGEEIRRKLKQGGGEAELIDEVLEECTRQGFINETRAAETASEQLIAKGPVGAPKLLRELLRRGCQRQLAEQMVELHCREQDNFSLALELLRGRQRSYETRLEQYRRKLAGRPDQRGIEYELRSKLSASMMNFLAGRGFSDSDARQAVREFCERLIGNSQT